MPGNYQKESIQHNLNSFVVSELFDIIFCMAQHLLKVYTMLSVAQVKCWWMTGWLVNGEFGKDVAGSSCGLICLIYYYYSIFLEQMSKTTTNFKLREAARLKVFWEQCAEENIRTHEIVREKWWNLHEELHDLPPQHISAWENQGWDRWTTLQAWEEQKCMLLVGRKEAIGTTWIWTGE